jgi:hypothetical protein
MQRDFSRPVLVIALLLLVLVGGCIPFVPVYFGCPTVACVPGVPVAAPAEEIRAFRVAVADDRNCVDFPEKDRYLLSAVPLGPAGTVPPQVQVALDYGWVWNCIALVYGGFTHHTIMVRLYRPGWQTVEIRSWQKKGSVIWKEAVSAAEREVAIDTLLSTWETDASGHLGAYHAAAEAARDAGRELPDSFEPPPPQDASVFGSLAPGSASGAHRQALRFAAAEYERLAAQLAADDAASAQRARLADKARRLRELAEK